MTDAVLALPTHLRRRLVDALTAGRLPLDADLATVNAELGMQGGAGPIVDVLHRLGAMGASARAAAEVVRAIEQAAAAAVKPDLVWSGPEVPGIHARDTRRVFEELFAAAKASIWVSSFAYFDGPRMFEGLARRMEAVSTLDVTLLLNIQRGRGDTSSAESLVRRFADTFWDRAWPGSRRPAVYYDPRSLEPDGPKGVLHAKAVVVDDEMLFVTSANFTEAAWERNFELGVLVRERALAATAACNFRTLIERGLLKRLPGE